ncbi:hypothetical protein J437_LFUL009928 [Ladona fulva]|uniref:RNA-directed DNA polymerase n=1 Tax=Ladona fulva TaxID=123851 RepID=A0A8K0KCQ4_LADFU|nr:hypothetical protein J437_LFUL009928 [Ladona fulva]
MPGITADEMRTKQAADTELLKIMECFEGEGDQVDFSRWTERGFLMLNGVLYRYSEDCDESEAQLVVSRSLVPRILEEYHDAPTAGHYVIEKTFQKIASHYYWTGMRQDIRKYVKGCLECQRYKPDNLKPAGLLQTPVQNQRFEKLPLGILVVEDTATRWVFPLKEATAAACFKCLVDEVILRYGTPRRVISDNGPQFVSEVMQKVAHCLGFKQSLIPVYHPEANPTERKNRDLKTQLGIHVATCHSQWREHLPSIQFAMNSTSNQYTGHTAAYLSFSRELRSPGDVQHDMRAIIDGSPFVPQITPYLRTFALALKEAKEKQQTEQDQQKKAGDQKRRVNPDFQIGDKVLVNLHPINRAQQGFSSKLAPRRDGPYVVVAKKSPSSFQIARVDNPGTPVGVYHASALHPFTPTYEEGTPLPVHPLRKRGRPRRCVAVPQRQDAALDNGTNVAFKFDIQTCTSCDWDGYSRFPAEQYSMKLRSRIEFDVFLNLQKNRQNSLPPSASLNKLVSSTWTTASAPGGSGAPVFILIHSPGIRLWCPSLSDAKH